MMVQHNIWNVCLVQRKFLAKYITKMNTTVSLLACSWHTLNQVWKPLSSPALSNKIKKKYNTWSVVLQQITIICLTRLLKPQLHRIPRTSWTHAVTILSASATCNFPARAKGVKLTVNEVGANEDHQSSGHDADTCFYCNGVHMDETN